MEDTDYGEYEVRSEERISTTQWSRGKLVTLRSSSKVHCYLSVTTAAGRDTLLPGPAITHTLYNV